MINDIIPRSHWGFPVAPAQVVGPPEQPAVDEGRVAVDLQANFEPVTVPAPPRT